MSFAVVLSVIFLITTITFLTVFVVYYNKYKSLIHPDDCPIEECPDVVCPTCPTAECPTTECPVCPENNPQPNIPTTKVLTKYTNVQFPDSTDTIKETNKVTESQCYDLCMDTQECNAFSLWNNRCYIKNVASGKKIELKPNSAGIVYADPSIIV